MPYLMNQIGSVLKCLMETLEKITNINHLWLNLPILHLLDFNQNISQIALPLSPNHTRPLRLTSRLANLAIVQ